MWWGRGILERPGLLDAAARALRPYTRTSNALLDLIKPKLYHKVDRSVLDALVRRLEGFSFELGGPADQGDRGSASDEAPELEEEAAPASEEPSVA